MGKYTIKDLERLSGVKAHTIRIWEKRHSIVKPSRTDTNIRFYSDDDLKKIINVSVLNNNGMRISQIAGLTSADMNAQVRAIGQSGVDSTVHIDQMIVAMIDIDEARFEKILNTLIIQMGFEETITSVVYPFLHKIGILWQTENITPAHEHFISNLIRQKLFVAVDGLPFPGPEARVVILFLPEGELHEIALLFSHYLARKYGYRSYYLGQSVPHKDLATIVAQHKAQLLITCITSPMSKEVTKYLSLLSRDFPRCTILVSGIQLAAVGKMPRNIISIASAGDLKAHLTAKQN
ncbi:MAG: MerR family transcriptional regulator [Chryseolinea sp.]